LSGQIINIEPSVYIFIYYVSTNRSKGTLSFG